MHSLQIGMEWHPEAPGSGVGRMYYGLARHLPRTGVSVSGLVTGPADLTESPPSIQAFAPASASLPRRLWSLRSRTAQCLQADVDLVASHFALYTVPLLDLLDDRPLVIHFHGPWAGESQAEKESAWVVWAKKQVERIAYRRATRFIVLSSAFRETLTTRYDIPTEQVDIVPGGVDTDRFDTGLSRRAARKRLDWPTDRPILFSVRRLVRRTGLSNLVDAIDRVQKEMPEIQLYIAGTGPLRDALAQKIRDAGLSEHIALLGFVPDADLPLAYRAADLSVVPTIAQEGFGLVVVESLAAGTPALVTPVGGLPEIVSDFSEALLLPNAHPETIARRIRSMLNGTISLPSSEACQHYAQSHYAWPAIANQVRDVYSSVL